MPRPTQPPDLFIAFDAEARCVDCDWTYRASPGVASGQRTNVVSQKAHHHARHTNPHHLVDVVQQRRKRIDLAAWERYVAAIGLEAASKPPE